MAFFRSLKKSLRTIDNEISEFRRVETDFLFYPEVVDPTPNLQILEPEEIEKKISETKAKIRSVRIATSKVKINLKHRQDLTRGYFYDIEELSLDVLDEYKQLEKKLVQYGYCPLKLDNPGEDLPKLESNLEANDDSKNEQKVIKSLTPKLCRKKNLSTSTPELCLIKKNIDKTPELCLDEKPKVLTKSVSTDLRKKTAKYGDIARRLDF